MRVAYFTVDPKKKDDLLRLDWLNPCQIVESNKFTEWYHFDKPIHITVDGISGIGNIYQPENIQESESMDEEDSSGI